MKRTVLAIGLTFLSLFSFAQESEKVILFKFEGTVQVFVKNRELKAKPGMALSSRDIVRAKPGAALLFFPGDDSYGVIKDASSFPSACLRRKLAKDQIDGIKAGKISILEGFLKAPAGEKKGTGETALSVTRNINLVVIMDTSSSIRGQFSEMTDYVKQTIIGSSMKSGDYLCLFTFGANVKTVFEGSVELPKDKKKLDSLIDTMRPVEQGTDIGLMLENLDKKLKDAKFPNKKTTIFWVTDGKNDPPWASRYRGMNVYDPKAFDTYKIVKSAYYKVLLLSIGSDTAARSLSDPLGGEYIEVARDVTAQKLGELISNFKDSIEMILPETLGRLGGTKVKVPIAFLSTYPENKIVKLLGLSFSVDGQARQPVALTETEIPVDANDRSSREFTFELPGELSKGEHVLELELQTANNMVLRPVQQMRLEYAPFPILLTLLAGSAILLIAIIVIAVRTIRKRAKK